MITDPIVDEHGRPTNPLSKVCPKCDLEKPFTEFYPNKAARDKLSTWCKMCHREYDLVRDKDPERIRKKAERRKEKRPNPSKRVLACERAAQWVRDNPERAQAYRNQYYAEHGERICENTRQKRKEDPDRFRNYELKKRFKMTLEDFNRLLAKQNGACAGCLTTEPGGRYNQWHVDHDHTCCNGRKSCGKCVRGLLCHACNTTLGNARDSRLRLLSLARYLKIWEDKPAGRSSIISTA